MNLILRLGLAPSAALFMAVTAHAATITANFTYTGTGKYTVAETALGSGSFTVNGTSLTAFSFTDTLHAQQVETFTYGLADIASVNIGAGATSLSNLVLTITTNALTGSPDAFGLTSFTLHYSAANPGSGSTSGDATSVSQFTTGAATLTAVQTAPEPAAVSLFAVAGAGVLLLKLRWRRAVKASPDL